ncbi:hypothetical protein ACLNGM_14870 [Aureimonas phyllosphaerae]|uniref:hypothetical protein n=1 Tax=Aureimonas phyllosphaerae TaxID=1166078 RepID=UPI003A5C7756
MTTSPTNAAGDLVTDAPVAWVREGDMKKLAKSQKPLQLWVFNRDPSDISGTPYVALSPEGKAGSAVADASETARADRHFEQSQRNAKMVAELEARIEKMQAGSAAAVQRERDRAEHAIKQQLINERRYQAAEARLTRLNSRAASIAESAFDDRPRARSDSADWNDGYLDGTRAAAAAIRAALSSPAQEGEAAPVRTDADGELHRLLNAVSNMLFGDTERDLPELEEAAKPFIDMDTGEPFVRKHEGETGPAVAEPVAYRCTGNPHAHDISDILVWERGTAESYEQRGWSVTPLYAALTVSPSPSERDQHQGETGR